MNNKIIIIKLLFKNSNKKNKIMILMYLLFAYFNYFYKINNKD
jgi:hypothetical protein